MKRKCREFGDTVINVDAEGCAGQNHVTLNDLCRWAAAIRQMPYYWEAEIADRNYIVVHAGYADSLENTGGRFDCLEQFFLYTREESLQSGGVAHSANGADA